MLEVFSTDVTVASGGIIPLNSVIIDKGCSAKLIGAGSIEFNKCGVYLVTVNANSISQDATGEVSIQLSKNGTLYAIPSSETVVNATATHALALSALVQVPGNNSKCNACTVPTIVSVVNAGNAAVIDIDVVVTPV